MKEAGDITDDTVELAAPAESLVADGRVPYESKIATAPKMNAVSGKKALSNAAWTFGGFGGQQVVRFLSTAILWQWLSPAVFGLVAAVYLIRDGLMMFSDIGIGQSLIQSPRTDKAFQHTAWTTQVLRGVLIFVIVALSAPLIAKYFLHDLSLWWIVPVIALVALIDGLASTSLYTHARRMKVAGVSMLELGAQIVSSATIVAVAYFTRDVRALLAGGLAQSIVRTAGSHWLNRDTPDGIHLEQKAFHEIVIFGKWIVVSSIIMFLASNTDRVVLQGWLVKDLVIFGVYGTALNIAMIPLQTILRVGIRVVFPVFSNTINSGGDVARAFAKARRFVATGGGFSSTVFLAAGPAIVAFLSPKAYHDAGVYLSIMAVSIWLQTLDAANQALLTAKGQNKWGAFSNITKLVLLLVAMPIGYKLDGMKGALYGIVLADLCKYLVSAFANVRLGMPLIRIDLLATVWFGVVAVGLQHFVPHDPSSSKLTNFIHICIVSAGAMVAAGIFFLWLRGKRPTKGDAPKLNGPSIAIPA
ncbi:MAG: oligosaccharide flippase family protein [Tepidisphaeraceae bacterium]